NLSYSERWLSDRTATVQLLLALGFEVHNAKVTDIRKRNVQSLNRELGLNSVTIDHQNSPGELPVMVKSNYNYGGVYESALGSELSTALGFSSVAGCEIQGFDGYYKTTLAQVDKALFEDERVVIERYIDNQEQRFYRFYRCGEQAILSMIINPDVIKKMRPGLPRKNWYFKFDQPQPISQGQPQDHHYPATIDDATVIFQKMEIDFGAVDIVMDDEYNGYIIDVNPTPGWGAEKQEQILDYLRQGIK
ncbi:MAG: hypothetical protein HRT35_15695, partial [Algicola sp.]|nr:hypothetical protein [Algicola sp.]